MSKEDFNAKMFEHYRDLADCIAGLEESGEPWEPFVHAMGLVTAQMCANNFRHYKHWKKATREWWAMASELSHDDLEKS